MIDIIAENKCSVFFISNKLPFPLLRDRKLFCTKTSTRPNFEHLYVCSDSRFL